MQRLLTFKHRSEEEEVKDAGLVIDYDEIARKGTMSKEEVSISKWFGIYSSRHPGSHMARVVIPGGQITSSQARLLARAAEQFAQGKLCVTTRQAIQLHWLKTPSLADLLRMIEEEGMSTFHGCGDVTRNVTACPLAETCRYRRLNVRPHAKEIAEYLTSCRDLDNLPRKFKITLSGCGAGCAQPFINCVGIVGVQRAKAGGGEESGFKVIIGGGMGWKAFVGQELFSFVPPEKIKYVCRAVGLLFRDHGDRYDRSKSRLKFVVHRLGIPACREIVLAFLKQEGHGIDDLESAPIAESGVAFPERPLTEEDPVGTDGRVTVRAIIPKGELDHHAMRRLAQLSEIYGDKRIYTTNRQNIELHGVLPAHVADAKAEIRKLGFGTDGNFGIRDIVPCVGTTYCPLAVSRTRDMYDLLMDVVRQPKYDAIAKKVLINITGCPNSCSPFRIADIGLRGMRIREELGSAEGYEIRIGGTHDAFGRKVGEFKKEDCPAVITKVLDTFMAIRQGEETLAECVRRTGFGL
ncbi:MAG: nitrite/sulfite reductase [Lentisphaerae bacterium]|nr:nitrite/sulfite reductase [Lentisphaerota bacterium]